MVVPSRLSIRRRILAITTLHHYFQLLFYCCSLCLFISSIYGFAPIATKLQHNTVLQLPFRSNIRTATIHHHGASVVAVRAANNVVSKRSSASNVVIEEVSNDVAQQSQQQLQQPNATKKNTYTFSVPLTKPRPKPTSPLETFNELWNDPRPISAIIASDDRSYTGVWEPAAPSDNDDDIRTNSNNSAGPLLKQQIPYCIISEEFEIENETFQILLYPRGRFVGNTKTSMLSTTENDGGGSTNVNNERITGPASAYLRYLPKNYGDEIDIAWKLKLCSTTTASAAAAASADDTALDDVNENVLSTPLPIVTSGGLPKSNTTWSAAMTFCAESESVESVGRTTDWGSSIWSANDVCNAVLLGGGAGEATNFNYLVAEGEITVFDIRKGESSFAWPLFSKGAIGAVTKAASKSKLDTLSSNADFRVGEVIVPRNIRGLEKNMEALKDQFIYPGVDYRIMTMTDKYGNQLFSTESLSNDEKHEARLALRPCGWKIQQQLWKSYGMKTDWPVEVNADMLSNVITTRFNTDSAIPRVVSAFQRDWKSYTLALAVALTPIPLSLVARNFVSFYAIPSASMEPTLLKGDLLLVEKLPRVYERTKRGDVILFQPPPSLKEVVMSNGSQLSSTSLFVKRIVGLPGDENIRLVEDNNVMINGKESVGPDRNLCADEPLRLIDRLLETGKGKDIAQLGVDDVYVLGDCKAVSVDSRVFGTLPKGNIVGKPLARIWPLDRLKLSGDF